MMHLNAYKVVNDGRSPVLLKHDRICYPPPNKSLVQSVDISFPGIVIDFGNDNYLLEDGCHRIAKLQSQGVYESLFYIVTIDEYKSGMVSLIYGESKVTLGEWNHKFLDVIPH